MDDQLIVCRCEEVTLAQVEVAVSRGARSIMDLKFHCRAGAGHCQGRQCQPLLVALLAARLGLQAGAVQGQAPRQPRRPVCLARLAEERPAFPDRDALTLLPPEAERPPAPPPEGSPVRPSVGSARSRPALGPDVVVVGAGVVGAATAYYLARAGLRVVVLDQAGIAREASGRNSGGIRQHGRGVDLPLAREALLRWAELNDELEEPFGWRQAGDVLVALTEREMLRLERAAQVQREAGLHVELVDRAGLRELLPGLTPRALGGSHCPTDAQANPVLAVWSLVNAVRRRGGSVLTGTTVLRLLTGRQGVRGVVTSRGTFQAPIAVLAAGPWTRSLALTAGVSLELLARRSQLAVTEPLPGTVRPFFAGNAIYGRQTDEGNIVFGGGGSWERVEEDPIPLPRARTARAATPRTLGRLATRLLELFPGLGGVTVLRAFSGLVDLTPDGLPLAGPVPGVPGLYVAAGTSGHGFGIAPAIGHRLAEAIVTGTVAPALHRFAPLRFPPDLDFPKAYRARYGSSAEPVEGVVAQLGLSEGVALTADGGSSCCQSSTAR